jgi:hypothetical protein
MVSAGTKEICINLDDDWFRVMYVVKFPEAVYVLHCFKKKTTSTSKHDNLTNPRAVLLPGVFTFTHKNFRIPLGTSLVCGSPKK